MKTETEQKPKVQELERLELLSEGTLVKVRVVYDRNNFQNTPIDVGYCDIHKNRVMKILVPRPDSNTVFWQYVSKEEDITIKNGGLCLNGDKTHIINTHHKNIEYRELYNKLKNAGLLN